MSFKSYSQIATLDLKGKETIGAVVMGDSLLFVATGNGTGQASIRAIRENGQIKWENTVPIYHAHVSERLDTTMIWASPSRRVQQSASGKQAIYVDAVVSPNKLYFDNSLKPLNFYTSKNNLYIVEFFDKAEIGGRFTDPTADEPGAYYRVNDREEVLQYRGVRLKPGHDTVQNKVIVHAIYENGQSRKWEYRAPHFVKENLGVFSTERGLHFLNFSPEKGWIFHTLSPNLTRLNSLPLSALLGENMAVNNWKTDPWVFAGHISDKLFFYRKKQNGNGLDISLKAVGFDGKSFKKTQILVYFKLGIHVKHVFGYPTIHQFFPDSVVMEKYTTKSYSNKNGFHEIEINKQRTKSFYETGVGGLGCLFLDVAHQTVHIFGELSDVPFSGKNYEQKTTGIFYRQFDFLGNDLGGSEYIFQEKRDQSMIVFFKKANEIDQKPGEIEFKKIYFSVSQNDNNFHLAYQRNTGYLANPSSPNLAKFVFSKNGMLLESRNILWHPQYLSSEHRSSLVSEQVGTTYETSPGYRFSYYLGDSTVSRSSLDALKAELAKRRETINIFDKNDFGGFSPAYFNAIDQRLQSIVDKRCMLRFYHWKDSLLLEEEGFYGGKIHLYDIRVPFRVRPLDMD